MSNKMISSFKKILERNQENLNNNDFTITEDKKIIKLFSESLKYLEVSLKNIYDIYALKIVFHDEKNDYNDLIFEATKSPTNDDFRIINTIKLSQNAKIIFQIYTKDKESLNNLQAHKDAINITLDIISQTLYNKYLEECIKELSLKDQITGLYNRKYLEIYLEKVLSLSKRENKKVAFLKVGINHFKAVIDEFDYNIGDKVLIKLANLLKDTIRASDIVVRVDADEFLIVLQNIQDEENAILVAQKLIEGFSKKEVIVNEQTNQTLKKTICVGISLYPEHSENIDEIIRDSDNALYEAKNKGRSEYFLYKKEAMNTIDLF